MNKIKRIETGTNELLVELKVNDNITIRMFEYENLENIGNIDDAVLIYVSDSSQNNSGWCLEYNSENKDLYVNYNQFYDIDEGLTDKEYDLQYKLLEKYFDDIKASTRRLITYFKKYETNKLKTIRQQKEGN